MRSKSALSLVTTEQSIAAVEDAVTEAYRSQWGRLLSVLVVRTRRLDLAEDALAEAFTRAATRWPFTTVFTPPAQRSPVAPVTTQLHAKLSQERWHSARTTRNVPSYNNNFANWS
jgi:predicted RNA polymerase sigma factor